MVALGGLDAADLDVDPDQWIFLAATNRANTYRMSGLWSNGRSAVSWISNPASISPNPDAGFIVVQDGRVTADAMFSQSEDQLIDSPDAGTPTVITEPISGNWTLEHYS